MEVVSKPTGGDGAAGSADGPGGPMASPSLTRLTRGSASPQRVSAQRDVYVSQAPPTQPSNATPRLPAMQPLAPSPQPHAPSPQPHAPNLQPHASPAAHAELDDASHQDALRLRRHAGGQAADDKPAAQPHARLRRWRHARAAPDALGPEPCAAARGGPECFGGGGRRAGRAQALPQPLAGSNLQRRRVRQHGQHNTPPPFGCARARPLPLLGACLAALGGSALSGRETGPLGAQSVNASGAGASRLQSYRCPSPPCRRDPPLCRWRWSMHHPPTPPLSTSPPGGACGVGSSRSEARRRSARRARAPGRPPTWATTRADARSGRRRDGHVTVRACPWQVSILRLCLQFAL